MALTTFTLPTESARDPRAPRDSGDAAFFAGYSWCLNPILTLDDQVVRLGEELHRIAGLAPGWQRDECVINVHLLVCGIACTVDDYLARPGWELGAVARRMPRLGWAVAILRAVLNVPHALAARFGDRRLREWRDGWTGCVDAAARMVIRGGTPGAAEWTDLDAACRVARAHLPARVRGRRLRIPEGYRCQDLSHHDVIALARRFAQQSGERSRGLAVVGVRTAGAYFAPLVKAELAATGWGNVSWLTIRPQVGPTASERWRLHEFGRTQTPVVVIDDHPNTGATLGKVLATLVRAGIAPERIAILTPRHLVEPDWRLPRDAPGAGRVALVTVEPEESYKARLLTPSAVEPLLRDWFGAQGWRHVAVRDTPEVDAANQRLARHGRDGFQVRLKRVFRVELGRDGADRDVRYVVAKSVGWGWLGYHAYLVGTRLAGLVPPVIGWRHGMLFSEWIGTLDEPASATPPPVLVTALGHYLVRRTRSLPLTEDPRLGSDDSGWYAWKLLLSVLRRAYGPYAGRLKVRALRDALHRFASPRPTLIDGQMRPADWVTAGDRTCKVDYEQHNFGTPELDVVDAAYDLASTVFEFRLDEAAEAELVGTYARGAGDRSVGDRLLMYKLLVGTAAMEQAASWVRRMRSASQGAHWNERYLAARNFLTHQLHRACAGFLPPRPTARWSDALVFLDVDGVFDCELLGFPHTTVSGLTALALLQAQGFAVVLNTGRSVEHVREYCRTYGLPGGIAEYGSVLFDAVTNQEVALCTPAARERLAQCRDALAALPGVFVDRGYRYSVRAYRFAGGGTVGLVAREVQELLARGGGQDLAQIATSADSYVVDQAVSKGTGLTALKRRLGMPEAPVIAIGDSDQDVAMLELAEQWYAPGSCSARVRELARATGGRVVAGHGQRGLLQATTDVLQRRGAVAGVVPGLGRPTRVQTFADLLLAILRAADRPRAAQVLAAVAGRGL